MSKAVLIINDESHSTEGAIFHQFGSKVDTPAAAATSAVITTIGWGNRLC